MPEWGEMLSVLKELKNFQITQSHPPFVTFCLCKSFYPFDVHVFMEANGLYDWKYMWHKGME